MKNKNIYIIVGIVVIILIAILALKPGSSIAPSKEVGETGSNLNTGNTGSKTTKATETSPKSTTNTSSASNFPSIDFIDKRIYFEPSDFKNVKITIEKVAFGRGETVTSTGCSGIPNADFSTYLYPGSGICINESKVDGSPKGIVAFHVLIENNGQVGFGGSSNIFRLHYLRPDPASGKPVHKFANPLTDLSDHYINQFSSKEVILSYLVPEDQLVYDFVYGYKEPLLENKTLNVYDFSVNGFLVDFSSKNIKLVK